MDAVGNDFYGHRVGQVNAFNRTFILVFTTFVEARHGVVEMGGMGKSGLISRFDFIIFGFSMGDGGQDTA